MQSQYQNKFNYQVLFFLISVVIIFTTVLIIIDRTYIDELFMQDFHHELEKAANTIDYDIKIKTEHVKAMSSRTMIRKELYKWYNSEIPLSAVQAYTKDKYRDGAAVYDDIIYAVRYDKAGQLISTYPVDGFSELNPVTEHPLYIRKEGTDFILYIENRIIHNGIHIGYDCAAFKIPSTGIDSNYLKNMDITENSISSDDRMAGVAEIGDTGFSLTAEVNDIIKSGRINKRYFMILKWLILFFILLLIISHITIFHFSRGLISIIEELHNRDLRNERQSAIAQVGTGLAHDLNNKFNIIIGYTEMLLQKDTAHEIHDSLEIIHSTSWEASEVINKLYHYTSSRFCRFQDVEAVVFFKDLFAKSHVEFDFKQDIDYSIPDDLVLSLDKEVMESAIHSILLNSHEAGASVITISLALKNINDNSVCTICSKPMKGEWFSIKISDDSGGFDDGVDTIRLLEPFYTTKGARHAGLGLSQVYGTIHQHQGHIIFNRTHSAGMEIELILPMRRSSDEGKNQ
jgi:signal transduction histidine kinase